MTVRGVCRIIIVAAVVAITANGVIHGSGIVGMVLTDLSDPFPVKPSRRVL